jgi:hypothetical protein
VILDGLDLHAPGAPRANVIKCRIPIIPQFTESPISRCFTWFGDHGSLQLIRIALDVRCNGPVVILHYKFTGKERDAESGLDNFGARYDAGKPLLKKREMGPCRTQHLTLRCPEAAPRPFFITFLLCGHHRHRIAILQSFPDSAASRTASVSRYGPIIRRKTIFGGSLTTLQTSSTSGDPAPPNLHAKP